MSIQPQNNLPATARHTPVPPLEDVGKPMDVGLPMVTLRIGSRLNPGLERRLRPNEDTLFVSQGTTLPCASSPSQSFALLLVADGMGGQEHGQEASRLAAQSLGVSVLGPLRSQQLMSEAVLPLLVTGVEQANQAVYQHNQAQQTRMGTTMTAALVIGTTAYVAHVGDSRLYHYHQPLGLAQITHDHSLVAALVAAGTIQPEDIYTHPQRNQIYRNLGEHPTVEVDTHIVSLADEDMLLLCSDGLWEMVRDPQIATILMTPQPNSSATAQALVQAALAGGGADNISVIVAQVNTMEVHPVVSTYRER
ncbi:MAG: protein phosphatase 2C domain-containing protein [Ktedonobacteraceae bacterium]